LVRKAMSDDKGRGGGGAVGTSGLSVLFVGTLERPDTGILAAMKGANRRRERPRRRFCRD